MFHKCKITVIDKKFDKKLVENFMKDPKYMKKCDQLEVGQEFIVDNPFDMPEGICASAWSDIRSAIITAATGGSFSFFKNPDFGVAICSDPFRPVTFQIERLN